MRRKVTPAPPSGPERRDRHYAVDAWTVTLVTPCLSPQEHIAREAELAEIWAWDDSPWPEVWASFLLTTLVQTLPVDDPWQWLAASDGETVRHSDGIEVPEGTVGAWLPDRPFGTYLDQHDLIGGEGTVRLRLDPRFAPVAEDLDPWSACLIGKAAHSSDAVLQAIARMENERNPHALRGDVDTTREVLAPILAALRWVAHRHSLYRPEESLSARVLVASATARDRADARLFGVEAAHGWSSLIDLATLSADDRRRVVARARVRH